MTTRINGVIDVGAQGRECRRKPRHIHGSMTRRDFFVLAGRVSAAAGVTGALGLANVACEPPEDPSQRNGGGGKGATLTFAQGADMTQLDPHIAPGGINQNAIFNLFEGLYNQSIGGEIVLGLAMSDEGSEDGLTRTFELREDVVFHNGDPLTAEDVKFSFERILDPDFPAGGASNLSTFDGVSTDGNNRVIIKLKKPDPILANKLSFSYAAIVPKKYVTEVGDEEFNRRPVGTGPFRFVEAQTGQSTTIAAFDNYWGEKATIGRVVFTVVPEEATRIAQLQAGDVDLIASIDPIQVENLENSGLRVIIHPSATSQYLVIQHEYAPFQDVRVRQALNYAVDKQAIVENIFAGTVPVLAQVVASPKIPGYNRDLDPYSHDPDKARQLLEEANFDFAEEFVLSVPRGRYPKGEQAGEVIASNLRDVGLKPNLQVLEYNEWLERGVAGELSPLSFSSGQNLYYDPGPLLESIFACDGGFSSWCDEKLDARFEALRFIGGRERVEALQELSAYIQDTCPCMFLWEQVEIYAMQPNVSWQPTQASVITQFEEATLEEG